MQNLAPRYPCFLLLTSARTLREGGVSSCVYWHLFCHHGVAPAEPSALRDSILYPPTDIHSLFVNELPSSSSSSSSSVSFLVLTFRNLPSIISYPPWRSSPVDLDPLWVLHAYLGGKRGTGPKACPCALSHPSQAVHPDPRLALSFQTPDALSWSVPRLRARRL